MTTVGAKGGLLEDPIIRRISEVFPDQEPIDRVSTNAWADIRPEVEATGRRVLVVAGIWTEVCLAQTVLSAIKDGYTVHFVSDCSGGLSQEAHEDGKRRMVEAGANGINWVALATEWTPDYTTPEREALNPRHPRAWRRGWPLHRIPTRERPGPRAERLSDPPKLGMPVLSQRGGHPEFLAHLTRTTETDAG